MRYLIKFTKESDIKFVGHLDLMRTLQRVIRRSGIEVEYSKGFNPHIILSIAQPLSVGMYSEGEYMDLGIAQEISEKEVVARLNDVTCDGIKFISASKIEESKKKAPQAMALIDAAKYTIKVEADSEDAVMADIEDFLKKEEWIISKKNKKGKVKEINLKPMVKGIKHWYKDGDLVIKLVSSCGSRENFPVNIWNELLVKSCDSIDNEVFVEVKRDELYGIKDKKLVALGEYFK